MGLFPMLSCLLEHLYLYNTWNKLFKIRKRQILFKKQHVDLLSRTDVQNSKSFERLAHCIELCIPLLLPRYENDEEGKACLSVSQDRP
jgi:hypothetical protein